MSERLFHAGCVWNSFVMVGWVSAFLDLVTSTNPALLAAFAPLKRAARGGDAAAVIDQHLSSAAVVGLFGNGPGSGGAPPRGSAREGRRLERLGPSPPRARVARRSPAYVRHWLDRVELPEAG